MTKIFSTPKEVLTRVEAIPSQDMEKIQATLDSYTGSDLKLKKSLVTVTVYNELDKAGWQVINPSDSESYYIVRPKRWTYKLFSSDGGIIGLQMMGVLMGGAFSIVSFISALNHQVGPAIPLYVLSLVIVTISLFGIWRIDDVI